MTYMFWCWFYFIVCVYLLIIHSMMFLTSVKWAVILAQIHPLMISDHRHRSRSNLSNLDQCKHTWTQARFGPVSSPLTSLTLMTQIWVFLKPIDILNIDVVTIGLWLSHVIYEPLVPNWYVIIFVAFFFFFLKKKDTSIVLKMEIVLQIVPGAELDHILNHGIFLFLFQKSKIIKR